MGRKDEVTKDYMSDSTVFADAFNFFIYNGEKVIKPDQLNAVDATEIISMFEDKNKKHAVQRMRDILKSCNIKTDSTCTYILLGIENQSKVHYAMPIRNMLYDALQYAGQVDETSRRHRENRDYRGHSDSEFLSGFYKMDKLIPIITLVVLFNDEIWDAPMSIHDMLCIDRPELLKLVQDYRINLICPANIDDDELNRFNSSLKQVIGFIKYSNDKYGMKMLLEGDKSYGMLEKNVANVISICTGLEFEYDETEEVVDMCKAWKDMMEDCREEGREEGRGTYLTELISKKIKKGKSLDEIADEVEEPVEVVKRIIEEKCYAI